MKCITFLKKLIEYIKVKFSSNTETPYNGFDEIHGHLDIPKPKEKKDD